MYNIYDYSNNIKYYSNERLNELDKINKTN